MKHIAAGADSNNLIGQFGVGFYSAFLVADRVTVVSKSNNDPVQHIWESDAISSFTVAPDPRGNTLGRGTEIILHIKDDAKEYLNPDKLEEILTKYSQFINFPIYLFTKLEEKSTGPFTVGSNTPKFNDETIDTFPDDDKDFPDLEGLNPEDSDRILGDYYRKKAKERGETIPEDPQEDTEVIVDEDESENSDSEPQVGWKQMNVQKPIWVRDPAGITEDEYQEFYKTLTAPSAEAQRWIHFTASSDRLSFKALLYLPNQKPIQLFDDPTHSRSLKLFIKRVFITDQFHDIIPRYINFIKGVIDSDDLPLNVNREMLSENRLLKVMRRKIIRKILGMISDLQKPTNPDEIDSIQQARDDYDTFWRNFGTNMKLGIIEDVGNRQRIASLLRFYTSYDPEKLYSLDEYIENAKESQEVIYFIAGEDRVQLSESPMIEKLVDLGYQVLLLDEPIDEYAMKQLKTYRGWRIVDVTKEELEFDDDSHDPWWEQIQAGYSRFTNFLKTQLGDSVEKITVTNRLKDSPAIVTTQAWGHSANVERLAKSQPLGDDVLRRLMAAKKNLEINPYHPTIYNMAVASMDPSNIASSKDLAHLLYETARLSSGFDIEDKPSFIKKMHRIISLSLRTKPSSDMMTSEQVLAGLNKYSQQFSSATPGSAQDIDLSSEEIQNLIRQAQMQQQAAEDVDGYDDSLADDNDEHDI